MSAPALWLYRALFALALPMAAPFLWLTDRKRSKRRPSWAQRFGFQLPPMPTKGIWIQAVSVGEVSVAKALIAELRRRHPGTPIVLSATTATGLRLASGEQQVDAWVPFPVDLAGPVRRVLTAAQPKLVVLVETELWPEMLAGCARRGIPVVLVNARVSDSSFRGYRAVRVLLRPLLSPVTLALAQENRDAERLATIGIPPERIRTTGNIKFDISPPSATLEIASRIMHIAAGKPILVAGSTMPGEDELVFRALGRLEEARRPFVLVAPRHPERAADVLRLAAEHGMSPIRRTLIDEAPAACHAVVLDTIGELAALYELAAIAFVGGSLVPSGGHNPIEPARHGVPVLSGPHVRNFRVIYDRFVRAGAVTIVNNEVELATILERWLADPELARRLGRAGRQMLLDNAGATARTVDALEPFLQ
jgi:3-deoxy-D-manno-octulosonic-acid transferase